MSGLMIYLRGIAIIAMYNSIVVVGLSVFTGFTGLMSLGHASFVAVGAYTSAILTKLYGVPFALALPIAGIMAGLASLVIGIPTLRAKLRSDYFTIATLGFGEAVRVILENMPITNGARGLGGLGNFSKFWTVLVILVLVVFFTRNFVFSRYGRMSVAVREDFTAAELSGINLFRVRLRALFFSAFCAGIGGAIFAHYIRFIQPNMFTGVQSTLYLASVVAGGMGSITGPIVAAIVFATIPEALRVAEMWRLVFYGALLVLIMVVRPSGIFGYQELTFRGIRNFVRRLQGKKAIGPDGKVME